MALLLTSVIGNAIGLPYLQDDRTRNRNLQSDISRQKNRALRIDKIHKIQGMELLQRMGLLRRMESQHSLSFLTRILFLTVCCTPVGLCSAPNRLPSATFTKVRSTCSALTT